MQKEQAFVGKPFDGADVNTWPGNAGKVGESNYYPQNKDPSLPDPQYVGGKRRRTKKRSARRPRVTRKTRRRPRTNRKSTRRSRVTRKSRSKRHGGKNHGNTLLPQPIVNAGRQLGYHVKSFISNVRGSQPPINPNPLIQPIVA